MRLVKYIPIVLLLLLILIVAIWLNDWFTRWNGAIGMVSLSVFLATWVANFYYFKDGKNEFF